MMYQYDNNLFTKHEILKDQMLLNSYVGMILSINRNARAPGVYFLIEDKNIVYIGKSHNIYKRISTHIKEKRIVFDSFSYIAGKSNEMEYIKKFMPKYNRVLYFNNEKST